MIIPWILFARMRARNKGRTAKLASLISVIATVCCLTLIIPATVTAQSNGRAGFGSLFKRGQEMHWGFSHSDNDNDPTARDLYYPGSYTSSDGKGYWFKSIPWLGFASEETLFPRDVEGVNGGTDEEISIYPLTGLLMFRYPMGRFQPYLGIGPTLVSSGVGLQQMDILDSVFLGFSYTF